MGICVVCMIRSFSHPVYSKIVLISDNRFNGLSLSSNS
jgi:hypothetical protein